MKKVFLAALALMMCEFVNAQDVKFGVKGGLNVSNLNGAPDEINLKSVAGFNAGGFVDMKFSDEFSFQPEILYSQQGAEYKTQIFISPLNSIMAKFNFDLRYINLPLMVKYYAIDKMYIEAGPQIGLLVSAKGKLKADDPVKTVNIVDIKDFFHTVDFGLNLGLGYDFTKNISANARYNFGLTNIGKNEPGDKDKMYNRVFSFSAAYKF